MEHTIERFESTIASAKAYEDIAASLSLERPYPPYLYYRIQYFYSAEANETAILGKLPAGVSLTELNKRVHAYSLYPSHKHLNLKSLFLFSHLGQGLIRP